MNRTSIEWVNIEGVQGYTWNPVHGCTKVSPGCDFCYAEALDRRYGRNFANVKLHPRKLGEPAKEKRPSHIFVCSMADLFHKDVPAFYLEQVWEVMADTPWHTYHVLTKRAERMKRAVASLTHRFDDDYHGYTGSPLGNVWCAVSVEDPLRYGRIHELQQTPAVVRWLSCEPLLQPLPNLPLEGIDLVVIGGESGPNARRLELAWVLDIIDQCRAAGVAVFVKQLGTVWAAGHRRDHAPLVCGGTKHSYKGTNPDCWPPAVRVRENPPRVVAA